MDTGLPLFAANTRLGRPIWLSMAQCHGSETSRQRRDPFGRMIDQPRFNGFVSAGKYHHADNYQDAPHDHFPRFADLHELAPHSGHCFTRCICLSKNRQCCAYPKDTHEQGHLGQMRTLAGQNNGCAQGRADTGTPNYTQHKSDDKLTPDSVKLHLDDHVVTSLPNSGSCGNESLLQGARHQDYAE